MNTKIEAIRKTQDFIVFAWNPEDDATPSSYTVYVSTIPNSVSMVSLAANVSPQITKNVAAGLNKIPYQANIADVRTALSLASTNNFTNTLLYFTITYTENGSESAIADSVIVEVPPVGIVRPTGVDDPTANRNIFLWSDEIQKWHKAAGSSRGGIATGDSIYYQVNETQEWTYDSSGNPLTAKAYLSDATASGSYAKSVAYEYSDTTNPTKPTKIIVTDSTV